MNVSFVKASWKIQCVKAKLFELLSKVFFSNHH